jgi:anti-sigma regulatory factor (Ser/Thr protein kinase)
VQVAPDQQTAPLELPGVLVHTRAIVRSAALEAGLTAKRGSDAVLAVHEVTMNALTYGDGHGLVRVWTEDDELVCEVEDAGPGISDPLAGSRPPDPELQRGRGLWIARRLSDRLEIESAPGRTLVRLAWTL